MDDALQQRSIFRFGDFLLDTQRGTLTRGQTELALRPKSYAVLQCLVEGHGTLVSREELAENVWGHSFVTDGALNQCLRDVRLALRDHNQEMIRTVHRRGYRFDVPVETVEQAGTELPPALGKPDRRWAFALAIVLVAAITATFQWSPTDRAGEPVAEAREAYLKAIFHAHRRNQGDIERAHQLLLEAVRLDPEYALAWTELSKSYLRTAAARAHAGDNLLARASAAAEKAMALDPGHPDVQASVIRLYPSHGEFNKAGKLLDSALARHPDSQALLQVAMTQAINAFEFKKAIEYQEKLVAMDPTSALERGNLGALLMADRRHEEALEEFDEVLRLYPGSETHIFNKASALVLLNRFDEVLELVAPLSDSPRRRQLLAMAHWGKNDKERARQLLDPLASGRDLNHLSLLSEWYVYTGQTAKAYDTLDAIISRIPVDCPTSWACQEVYSLVFSYFLAPLQNSPRYATWVDAAFKRMDAHQT